MQVNSTQDYLTMKKRQLVSRSYYSTPPPQQGKTNGIYLSTIANTATIRQVLHVPAPSGWGDAPGGITVTSWCANCETSKGAAGTAGVPGVFSLVNTKDVVSRQALRPIGVRATVSQQ
jgi:hypothetical protein